MSTSQLTIAPKAPQVFENGITHPSLWLWDSWTYSEGGNIHLYALALNREDDNGNAIMPEHRNDHPFHFRHFSTEDGGSSWVDRGVVLKPSLDASSYYSRNVWSGSSTILPDNRKLMAFTGLREVDEDHIFLQSVGLAISIDGQNFTQIDEEPLSCPLRDYDAIISAGYYLGPKDELGHKDGEDGGPIMAWRDPYTFIDEAGRIHCFWSAKVSPKIGAIAHATLIETQSGFKIETLHPPITLPDGDTITQAEVPKIYFDEAAQIYYCLLSACDRLYEGQADSEVSKTLRLYKAKSLQGPWQSYTSATSILSNLPYMFGASIIETNYQTGEFKLAAPITERAAPAQQLTFAPIQTINIYKTHPKDTACHSTPGKPSKAS